MSKAFLLGQWSFVWFMFDFASYLQGCDDCSYGKIEAVGKCIQKNEDPSTIFLNILV